MGMGTEGQDVSRFPDRRKRISAEDFDWNRSGEGSEIELDRLREAGKIYHHENGFVSVTAKKCEDLGVVGKKKFERAAREGFEIFSRGNNAAHPPEQRRQILLLIFDVDRLVMVF